MNILLNYNYSLKSIKYYYSNNSNKKLEYLIIIFLSKIDCLYFFEFKNLTKGILFWGKKILKFIRSSFIDTPTSLKKKEYLLLILCH